MIERTLRITKLNDIYGPLLTERQRQLIDLHYMQDLSLGEIADQDGVTRQAVHDQLVRAERALESFEQRLGLLARHARQLEELRWIRELLRAGNSDRAVAELDRLLDE